MYRLLPIVLLAGLAQPALAQTPTTILPDHNGGIVANGRNGATTVTPDRQGGGAILGRDGATMLVPDGIGGYTAYPPPYARSGLRNAVPAEPRELLGGTRPPGAEGLRGGGSTLR